MKAIKVAVGLVLVLVLLLSHGALAQDMWMTPAGLNFRMFGEKLGVSPNGLEPDPSTIWIAVSEDAERWPAVAHGGDHIVVVYVKEDRHGIDNIFASVIPDESAKPLFYPISEQDADCGNPDIVYHASSGLFIVVYTCNQIDVFVRTFSPNTETLGVSEIIASGGATRGYPAIACNQITGSCLVAFHYDHSRVKGAYIDVNSLGVYRISPVYDLSDATTARRPNLAWGNGAGTYLVAYTEQHSTGEILPGYTHVIDYDDPMLVEKFLHPSTPAVSHDFSPSGYDALVSDVVFDPCSQKFLISIDYDATGDGSNFDVWAAVVHPTAPINIATMPIADTPVSEHSSAISFISGDYQTPSCGAMDRLLVGYINDEVGLMAVELRGNSSQSNPVYTCDAANQHHVVEYHTPMDRINAVRITSGAGERRFLMVNEIYHPFSNDYDIWGKYVGLLDQVFLPLVMR